MKHPKNLKPFRTDAVLAQPDNMIPHTRRVLDGEYDLPGLRLPDGATVLDLGANIGAFTKWAQQRWPKVGVSPWECNPQAQEYFERNLPGATPNRCAISTSPYVRLVKGDNNLGEARVVSASASDPDAIHSVAPDALPPAAFVKADMEGSEMDVIRHYLHWESVHACAIEYHTGADCSMATELMKGRGFVVHSRESYSEHTGILRFYHPDRAEWEHDAGEPAQPAQPARRNDYRHVLLAIPVHYQPTALFCQMVMQVAAEMPGLRIVWHVGDSHPDRARNVLANRFLTTDCTQLLFLDADLAAVGDQTITGLRSLIDRNLPVACGLYPKKRQGEVQWIGNFKTLDQDERGLVQVHEAGTGCMAIRRDVLESMRSQYPELRYTPDSGLEAESRGNAPAGEEVAFFASGLFHCPRTHRRRWLSEDWAFCRRAWDAGFEVVADPSVFFYHEGNVLFPLSWEGVIKEPNDKTEATT